MKNDVDFRITRNYLRKTGKTTKEKNECLGNKPEKPIEIKSKNSSISTKPEEISPFIQEKKDHKIPTNSTKNIITNSKSKHDKVILEEKSVK